jgi:diguanylate cyclase (GGDEF)-like protein
MGAPPLHRRRRSGEAGGGQFGNRSLRRSLGIVTVAAAAALVTGITGIAIVLDLVLPYVTGGAGAGGAAELLRVLLLSDALACLLVVGVLRRERVQLVTLDSSLAAERDRALASRATFEIQSEYVHLVLGVAEQMVGVTSTDELAAIVTSAVSRITGAEETALWLVARDGSLVRAGSGVPPRPPALYLASSLGPPPAPGWAVPLTTPPGDLLGVLEIKGRGRPPAAVAAIVETLASHAAGALEVQRQYAELRAASYTDPLTGLPNRWALDLDLSRACEESARTGTPLAVVMVDVDHFKPYNDLHGHAEGDRALSAIARILDRGLRRAGDRAYRYGGEEYVLILAGADAAAGTAVAERLRLAVKHATSSGVPRFPVTASFGVAAAGPGQRVAADLLAAADAELYRAKRLGRDRVATCPDSSGAAGDTSLAV